MDEAKNSNVNYFTCNSDGTITAFSEVGADPALHAERNRLVQEYASRQLPADYALPVRYVDEIGSDPRDGHIMRGGAALNNGAYDQGMVTEILIDKYAFDLNFLKQEFKGIDFDWKDVILHECGHPAYLDFLPSARGPIVLDGEYLMNEYYAMRAAALLPGAVAEPERASRLNAAAELYLRGELR
jgi:hypothetical protein